MKINKKIFICSLIALMLLFCVNAVSAEDTLNTELTSSDASEPVAIDSVDEVSDNGALAADSGSDVLKASGKTKYIDCSYNGTSDGTEEHPYKTIGEASSRTDEGDTFIIKNGEYTTDNKVRVIGYTYTASYIGESRDGVIIKSNDSSYSFVTSAAGMDLTLINLTFVLESTGSSYATPFRLANNVQASLSLINCSVVNSSLTKVGEFKNNHGNVLMDNLIVKDTTFYGSSADVMRSGNKVDKITITNSIFDNIQYDPSLTSGMASMFYEQSGSTGYTPTWNLDNVTITNSNINIEEIVYAGSIFNIVNSKISDNSFGSSCDIFFAWGGSINVQQSVISNNDAKTLFKKQTTDGTVTANYNNIHDNDVSTITASGNNIAYNLDDNWWGSSEAPTNAELGITNTAWALNTWVIDTGNYAYKIYDNTTGETSFLQKTIPELPGLEPVGSSVTIDPIAAVSYGDNVVVTYTVENETTLDIAVKDSTGAKITSGIDTSVPGQVTISGLVPGDYTIEISNEAEPLVEPSSANATFSVDKAGSSVVINPISSVRYPNDIVANYAVENKTTLNVVVKNSAGSPITTGVDTSVAGQVTISGLAPGTYTIDITNQESALYAESYDIATFKVNKGITSIAVSADNISYGEPLIVNVQLPADVSRRALVTVDGVSKYASLSSGAGSVKFDGLTIGNYTVFVSYGGDPNYATASASTDVEVTKGVATIAVSSVSTGPGNPLTVNAQLPSTATGSVQFKIGDVTKQATLEDGFASVDFEGLDKGNYRVTVTYGGDANYDANSTVATVKVTNPAPTIEITADDITYGQSLIVNVKMPSDVTRRPLVTVGDVSKYVSLKSGVGSVKFDGLAIGTYTVTVSYNGDTNYVKATNTTTVEVTKADANIVITADPISYGETLTVDVQLPSDATGTVEINSGDEIKQVTLNNGFASADFDDLAIGTHTITVTYSGDANYDASSATAKVKVNRATPEIEVTAEDISYGEPLVVNVQLPSDVTRRAVVTVDGVSKYVSLKSGAGSVSFTGLEVGTHEVQVSYSGDTNYAAASETIMVEVTQ